MNLYDILYFLHVAAATVWVGAGFGMLLLGNRALKAHDEADLAAVMRHLAYFSRVVFMPASIVVLVLGLYMTWYAYSFVSFWVLFGILGLAASGALGSMVLGPIVKEYAALDTSSGATPADRQHLPGASSRWPKWIMSSCSRSSSTWWCDPVGAISSPGS